MPGSLGERNWSNAARNRDSWQKLLKKALVQKGSKMGRWCDGRWCDGRCQEVGGDKLEECCKEQGQLAEASEESLGSKWAVVPMMMMMMMILGQFAQRLQQNVLLDTQEQSVLRVYQIPISLFKDTGVQIPHIAQDDEGLHWYQMQLYQYNAHEEFKVGAVHRDGHSNASL